ncbi:hypothetical protein ITJ86_10070 [Winogradskyella sp. F6397]|uniref:PKD/Chitinase domain-containing protein n=1 Tax=Winogradskyella marina TaxID=2785530 RepID=A0ABS0EIG3_9FLAO|nr:hypothetical protein [Winogradskyella marina]MBF8150245.1 hypothetical protein [Winogradskyella marina]
MKILKHTLRLCLLVMVFYGCTEDDASTSFVDEFKAPTNISANVVVTQDNTGLVTITPLGEGVSSFEINFGDGSEVSEGIEPGYGINHTYEEGTYEASIIGYGLNGASATALQTIDVSFQAPENLEVTIENDAALSKTVNVTATADSAIFYEVTFGEDDSADPISANIGETVSYTYQDVGTYTITVVAMGAAIETTSYTEEFEVTAILQPLNSAPAQPARAESDVISIFSAAYNDVEGSDYFPDWGQGGCCGSGWALFNLNGDDMLQYSNLSYQGNQFADPIDVSQMEYIHLDIWTADVLQSVDVFLISATESNGERAVTVDLTPNEWTSVSIPISEFTDQDGFDVTDIHQLKYEGTPSSEGTAFIDNIYFYRAATQQLSIAGTWRVAAEDGSFAVGPAVGDTSWYSCEGECVAARACYFDDAYVFGADGSFTNILGSESWIEPWQGGEDNCGAPVAPHDGSGSATYTFDSESGALTLNGVGAFIGLPKANNQGELPNVAVPESITYTATLSDNNNTMNVYIEAGEGVFWQFKLVKDGVQDSPIIGTWQMAAEAGSLAVGPHVGDTSWYSCDDGCVVDRACYFDDTYVFGADGSFANVLGTETWIEPWQGGDDTCGAPVAPHDGSIPATYSYDIGSGTLTIMGEGSYIGLPKATNQGELPDVDVPGSITYTATLSDNNNTMHVNVETGTGVFWQYKLVKN